MFWNFMYFYLTEYILNDSRSKYKTKNQNNIY